MGKREDLEIAHKHYRAATGRYLEEFTVGDVYEHHPGRTVSQQDNAWFTLLTMNTHPLHFDEEYAKYLDMKACGESPTWPLDRDC